MMRVAFTLAVLLAMPLYAADLELGIRHLSMSPRGDGSFDGSELEIVSSRGFGATAEVFWTPRISTQLAATFVNPATFLQPFSPFPTLVPVPDVDLGTFGIDTYSLTARYHLAPDARFSPFAGAGAALVVFGDLEDRFGDDIEMTFDRETAVMVEGGLRYRVLPHVFVDAAVSYMPLEATPNHVRNDSNVELPSVVKVDPLTVSVGVAWRF
jgi:outer membrane protein W